MSDLGPAWLLCHIVLDASVSMMDADQQSTTAFLGRLLECLREDSTLLSRTKVAVTTFTDEAERLVPVTDLRDLQQVPGYPLGGVSEFSALFRHLRDTMPEEVRLLDADGLTVGRPLVLILTDGRIWDDFAEPFLELTEFDPESGEGFPWYPYICPLVVTSEGATVVRAVEYPLSRPASALVEDFDDPVQAVVALARKAIASPLPAWAGDVIVEIDDEDFIC